jgi:hypothetical protein
METNLRAEILKWRDDAETAEKKLKIFQDDLKNTENKLKQTSNELETL